MKTTFRLASLSLVALLLAGCWDKEEAHSVSWYSEHNAERAEKIKACEENPGKLEDSVNCKNAKSAELKNSSGSLHKVDNW